MKEIQLTGKWNKIALVDDSDYAATIAAGAVAG